MKTYLECLPCFLRQAVIALSQIPGCDRATENEVLAEVLPIIRDADRDNSPAYTTTLIHRSIRKRLNSDPFSEIKCQYNDIAAEVCRRLDNTVARSTDPLRTAARLAIAGNVIDFGIYKSVDIESSVRRSLEERIAVDDYEAFRASVSRASRIMVLLDNAGEIAFDMLLIRELLSLGKDVVAVVKGSPVLNDVTMDDALQTGLTALCRVIDNGSDAVGTILPWTSPAFQHEFSAADLVISKGQANFETIAPEGNEVYYLFQSKCDVVSNELGLSPGSMLLKRS